ncbi:MAG TPA: hypothetical protein VIO57_09190 [Chloroflexota bacterium]
MTTPKAGGEPAESAAFIVQRLARSVSNPGTPWSPLRVSLITLILPAGGAVLTIRNLQRLHTIDPQKARELIIASIGVFAVGIVILLLLNPASARGQGVNGDATGVLGGGMAIVSYVVQRTAFRSWREANGTVRTGSWLPALGLAAVYSLVTLGAAVPVMLVAMLVATLGGHGTGVA